MSRRLDHQLSTCYFERSTDAGGRLTVDEFGDQAVAFVEEFVDLLTETSYFQDAIL